MEFDKESSKKVQIQNNSQIGAGDGDGHSESSPPLPLLEAATRGTGTAYSSAGVDRISE